VILSFGRFFLKAGVFKDFCVVGSKISSVAIRKRFIPSANDPPSELKFNLLENGIDFVRSGVEHYFLRNVPSARDHKYAVLHIFAGVLLLLKERLRLAHPSLIFAKVDQMNKPGAHTVNFDDALNRLNECAGVTIAPEQLVTLRATQLVRNQLEHYEVSLNLRDTQEIVGRLCEFVYVFMRDELKEDLKRHLDSEVWNRVEELRGIAAEIEKERLAEWQSRAKKYATLSTEELQRMYNDVCYPDEATPETPLACPRCSLERMVPTDEADIAVCTNPQCAKVIMVRICPGCGGTAFEALRGLCQECDSFNRAE